jgi:hypothetical protein
MPTIATKFYPITDIYFKDKHPVNLIPGQTILSTTDSPIIGFHIFNWGPDSWITVETINGQILKFPSTSLVEGAVYYMKFAKLIAAGPSGNETQVMAIS